MQMQEALGVVSAIEAAERLDEYLTASKQREIISLEKAKSRIPEDLRNTHPYSAQALWTFYARTHHDPEGETCNYCSMFDGQTFTGDMLRSTFPDHYWEGSDIYPDVHKTLWGKEGTCACLLIREPGDVDELNLSLWTQLGVDWTETPKIEDIETE
jgi:hypothetical protein